MKIALIQAINSFVNIIFIMLFIRAIMSWFIQAMGPGVIRVYEVLCNLTDPIIRPFRLLTVRLAGGYLDFSLLFAVITISFLRKVLVHLIWNFM